MRILKPAFAFVFVSGLTTVWCDITLSNFTFPNAVFVGEQATTTCITRQGGDSLLFEWSKNGIRVENSDRIKILSYSDLSTIVISSIKETDAGNYTCTVKSGEFVSSFTATLNVKAPSKWIKSPSDAEVILEETVSLACMASGVPQPTVVWKYSGYGKKDYRVVVESARYILKDAGTLSIKPVLKQDEGNYLCEITNGVGETLTKTIFLSVLNSPKLQPFSFPDTVTFGDRVNVFCGIKTGEKPLEFKWTRNGNILQNTQNVSIDMQSDYSVLTIVPSSKADGGNYTCSVTNKSGKDSFTGELLLKVPPTWIKVPQDVQSAERNCIEVICKADGIPQPEITWKRATGTNSFSTIESSGSLKIASNGSLLICPTNQSHTGNYVCEATNKIGPTLRKTVEIIINDELHIPLFQFRDNIMDGEKVTATCTTITGSGDLVFKWMKDNKEIYDKDRIKILHFSDVSNLVINPVTEEDGGNYTCIVTDGKARSSYTAQLNIKAPPKWIKYAMDTEVIMGKNVTLPCSASGKPAPTINWFTYSGTERIKVKSRLNTAKDGTLSFVQIGKTDEGYYECEVSNTVGKDLQRKILLSVLSSPKLQPIFFPEFVSVGERVRATCGIKFGVPPLKFKWTKDGIEINEIPNTSVDINEDYSLLTIAPVGRENMGNYTCFVENSIGKDTYTASLIVKAPPEWVKQPEDIHTSEGTCVELICAAKGLPQPDITWKTLSGLEKNFQVVVESKRVKLHRNGSLLICSTSKKDEGSYQCQVNNNVGTGLNKTVEVTVNDELNVSPFVFRDNVMVGEKVTATCTTITEGSKTKFEWLKDGKQIQESEQIKLLFYSDFSLIVINPVKAEDTGNYTCVVASGMRSNSYTTVLTVKAPPEWIIQPEDTTITLNTNVSLFCKVTGKPSPNISWRKSKISTTPDFKNVTLSSNIMISADGTLKFLRVLKSDEGIYECQASNGIGNNLRKSVILSVYNPKIQPFNFPENVSSGQKISVSCNVITGDMPLTFQWLKDNKEIIADTNIEIGQYKGVSILVINSVAPSSTGNYTCIVKNDFGSDRFTAFLIVKAPPKWKQKPENQEVYIGAKVEMNCQAEGYPLPKIIWLKEKDSTGQFIIVDSKSRYYVSASGNLTILDAIPEDSGNYKCEADNQVGEKLNVIISLLVHGAPKIQPFVLPDGLSVGNKASMSCSVISGDPPLTFVWLKNGNSIMNNHEINIRQYEDVSILVIEPLSLINNGNYTCVVKNNLGSDEFTLSLLVKAPPEWTAKPQNEEIFVGSSINLKCRATGYPEPRITWSKKNEKSGNFEVITSIPRYKIFESGDWNLTDAKEADSGNYECKADNGVGNSIAIIITLLVHDAPHIQPFGFPENIEINQKASVTCTVSKGTLPLSFKWKKDGQVIQQTSAITVRSYDDFSLLSLDGVKLVDSGNYSCLVANAAGEDVHTTVLTVKARARITNHTESKDVLIGTPVVLQCFVEGYPRPHIIWSKENPKSEFLTLDKSKQTAENTYSIPEAKESGKYKCEVSNGVGDAVHAIITLNVRVPARFEERFSTETVRQGDSAILKCDALGDQPLTVTWFRDKKELEISELSRYEKFETSSSSGLNSELYIRTVDRRDGAFYSCQAQNKYGSDERNIQVLVVEVPAQPLDVKIHEIWSRSANVKWTAPYAGNSDITKYVIQYWKDKAGSQRLQEEEVIASHNSVVINNLHPGTSYALTVIAENEIGHGEPSKTVRFLTGEEEPSGPPTDLWVEPRGPSTILVRWKAPPKEYWHGRLKGYYVGYRVESSAQPYSFKTVEAMNVNITHEYLLTSLMKSTRYSIVVKAYNSAGTGPASQELIVKTLDGKLPRPPSVSLLGSSESSISVKWGHTASKDEPVTGYTLHYRKTVGHWLHVPLLASDQTKYTLTGLDSGTTYNVYVTANNRFGRGDPSGILSIKTGDKGSGHMMPFYLDPSVIIPAAASLAAIIVVVLVVSIFLHKSRSRHTLQRVVQTGQQYAYAVNSSQRYIDMDKARPHSQPDPGTPAISVASYASIPSRIDNEELYGDDSRQEILASHNKQRPESFPRPSAIKKGIAHV